MIALEGLVQFSVKGKLEPEQFKELFQSLKDRLTRHIGKYVMLKEKDGRSYNIYLLEVLSSQLGRYKSYNDQGDFTGYVSKRIDLVLLFIGENQLVLLKEEGGVL